METSLMWRRGLAILSGTDEGALNDGRPRQRAGSGFRAAGTRELSTVFADANDRREARSRRARRGRHRARVPGRSDPAARLHGGGHPHHRRRHGVWIRRHEPHAPQPHRAPLQISLAIAAAFIFGLVALCIALLVWERARSRARLNIDRASSCVRVDSRSGRTELPLRDIEKAEIGSAIQTTAKGAPVTRYRLEFVLRDRQRVPATSDYYRASPGEREGLLEALNQELHPRSAMLS